MSDHESEAKKPKLDTEQETATPAENIFASLRDHAEAVDKSEEQADDAQPGTISADSIKHTGAYDAEGRPVQEIESLCMNCHEQGVTRLLFTIIPRFREVVIMSFECPHCGFKSNEVQPASEIQEKGSHIKVKLETPKDFARQVLKTQYASCKFVELDIELPPGNGRMTNVEGILTGVKEDLEGDQPVRHHVDPETYQKIEAVIKRIDDALEGKTLPLTFEIDDPSGNSFVEYAPDEHGNKWVQREYFRTPKQSRALGMQVPDDAEETETRNQSVADEINQVGEKDENIAEDLRNEVQTFESTCPACHAPTPTHMKVVNIPHFKDVIIMSTVCSNCGYKSNEVKTGGAVPEKARRITLNVKDPEDLSRDILKSDTCTLRFPELDLDLTSGTLGGRFTTIEGLLQQVFDELETKVVSIEEDTMTQETKNRWAAFLMRLQAAISGQIPFTVIMEDPLAASYIQNVYAPDPDPEMEIVDYERTFDENEDLGLNDINV